MRKRKSKITNIMIGTTTDVGVISQVRECRMIWFHLTLTTDAYIYSAASLISSFGYKDTKSAAVKGI